MKKLSHRALALILPVSLASCGGGGGSSDTIATATPTTPTSTVPSTGTTPVQTTPSTPDTTTPATTPPSTPVQEPPPVTPVGQDASQYTLTFAEEFNSGSTIDATRWSTDIWYKNNNATRNYDVADGNLRIWPQQDATGQFFDRTIVGDGKFSQQYGYFEVEAKLPVGAGLHPVISLIATDGPEIGIMHSYTGAPDGGWSSPTLTATDYVVTAVNDANGYDEEFRAHEYIDVPDLSAGFHKFGVRWDATSIRYYIDGVQMGRTINNTQVRAPMYFYIGLWMVNEGTSPRIGSGTLGINNAYTPVGSSNAMQVNYVRAWQFK
ncbi:glycoside hydrolase family 16 protein [Noviherbaspirillum galbum]|uniref:Glycoside hydrolase family 16 protein n=1 Tax=Noviherbaspirillum galbum TaxID=2709383 RepID=A0A6B3SXY9_9BURK|nr:glycoside hydrolase family 16 protein [Noviherbaspirillum galbum]NEX64086.1 glycoside hydrolase family 16 protein [Noviherbaspirillum galbum]